MTPREVIAQVLADQGCVYPHAATALVLAELEKAGYEIYPSKETWR